MQWLIDLIIDAIGVPPCYVDRGDPANFDFALGDFTKDGAWHDLDLSSIVPAGASAVALTIFFVSTAASDLFMFRPNGNTNERNVSYFVTQVAGVPCGFDAICSVDSNQILEYNAAVGSWVAIYCTVKGWWL